MTDTNESDLARAIRAVDEATAELNKVLNKEQPTALAFDANVPVTVQVDDVDPDDVDEMKVEGFE